MKRFVIKYTHRPETGPAAAWHERVQAFISALDDDPELKGRITYRCLKVKDTEDYLHFIEAQDDMPDLLAKREWFKSYTEETRRVAGGDLKVLAVETIAETKG